MTCEPSVMLNIKSFFLTSIIGKLSKCFFFDFLLRNNPGFDGLKIPERLFFRFQIEHWKKSIECDVPELLKAKCGHSKPVFPKVLVLIYRDQDLGFGPF